MIKFRLVVIIQLIIAIKSQQENEIETKYANSGQSVTLVCDLPNSMPDGQVIFLKSDNKIISFGTEIREDGDEQRYEINQQYAWEWSLKISSINEDDSGIYYCKIGNSIIRQFNIIVRVPPRIRDNDSLNLLQRLYKEGDSIKLNCFATGIPYPNITWYSMYDSDDGDVKLVNLNVNSNYLLIKNISRQTPTRYQCRASNGIPPSDNRNLSFRIQFAPEIEIQSKFDVTLRQMQLNCTIFAYPLSNKQFWRKDGNFLRETTKFSIENLAQNDYKLVSILKINSYDERLDAGLYECLAENDLRVSKIVYNLKDATQTQDLDKVSILKSHRIPVASIKNIEKTVIKTTEDYDAYDYDLSIGTTTTTTLLITKMLSSRRPLRKRPLTTYTRFSSLNRLIAQELAQSPKSISLKVNNEYDNDDFSINFINKKRNSTTRFIDQKMPILDLYRHLHEQSTSINNNNEFNALLNKSCARTFLIKNILILSLTISFLIQFTLK